MPAHITLRAEKDAAIESGYPDANRGNHPTMWVGRYSRNSLYRDLIRFDLSDMSCCVNITSAILNLYVSEATAPGVCAYVAPYRVIRKWPEDQVTWNTAPAYDAAALCTAVSLDDTGWYQWDVTKIVSDWFNGIYPNCGLLLMSTEAADRETKRFIASENTHTELRPCLKITYSRREDVMDPEQPSDEVIEPVTDTAPQPEADISEPDTNTTPEPETNTTPEPEADAAPQPEAGETDPE